MISYTDDKYTEYWKNKQHNQHQLKISIKHLLKPTKYGYVSLGMRCRVLESKL